MNPIERSTPVLHWYCYPTDRDAMKFLADAMHRFAAEVSRQTGISMIVNELPDEFVQVVNDLVEDTELVNEQVLITPLFNKIEKALPAINRLLLYCPNAPTIRHMAQREMKTNHLPWGVACVSQAFVFEPRIEQVIWHEALHTIGAGECYDEDQPKQRFHLCTDPERKCLMQFEPTLQNCGEGFPICERVLCRIKIGLEHC